MIAHPTNGPVPIDGKTSRSIRDAVGERLQQSMRPDSTHLPERLRQLMNALREQESQMH